MSQQNERTAAPGSISVILTTYNEPAWLEKVLWGYAVQTHRGFQLVVADDGSGPETSKVVERVREETDLDLLHVWHEDRGFRKCEILNRAILASTGGYLIFSDGDCIPRDDFVAVHAREAEPGRFLSGGYLKLPAEVSERITLEDIRRGRATDLSWLRARGWRPGRRVLRLLRSPWAATALDRLTPTRATWNGHNASTWRRHLFEVNGFDMEMEWGGLDRALGERLENLGLRGKQIRHRSPVLHLHHEQPYKDPAKIRRNREIRDRIRREGNTRAPEGLAELVPASGEPHTREKE
jgi:glycosyltransferase involved in cell wall biosynthesis